MYSQPLMLFNAEVQLQTAGNPRAGGHSHVHGQELSTSLDITGPTALEAGFEMLAGGMYVH